MATLLDWPAAERPREKLLARGEHSLSDAELLALFIHTGRPGKTALDIARELLSHFGGLRPLLESSRAELTAVPGIGDARYVLLRAALELGRRHLDDRLRRSDCFNSPGDTRRYVQARLRHHPREVFSVLFLDNQHQLIACEDLFTGTIDSASVYPREVVQRALALNAAAVILAHNHPSGIAEPSQADRRLTQRLVDALQLVDIRTLDHLVVGDGDTVSFAERGWL